MVTLCRTAQNKGKSWPALHGMAIQEVADSWEHPDWPSVLSDLKYIRDRRPEGPPERYSRPYRLQQVAWHNQSKAGADLIRDISGLCRHLPECFSRCRLTAYSPSIIIELAGLLYSQPAPADPSDSARVAKDLRQIFCLLGPSAVSCNFINTMRKGSPSYSLVWPLRKPSRHGRENLHIHYTPPNGSRSTRPPCREDGNTEPQLPSHHSQPSLDGSGIQASRAGPGLGERLEHPSLGPLNGDISIRAHP